MHKKWISQLTNKPSKVQLPISHQKDKEESLGGQLSRSSRFLSLHYIIIVVYSIPTTSRSDNTTIEGPEQTQKEKMKKLKMTA